MAGLGTSRSKTLLDDEDFISTLAERVVRYVAKKEPRAKGRRG